LILKKSILIFALLLGSISLYVIGCSDSGNEQIAPTPTRGPTPTGPPPGCEDIDIDPDCPAVSLTGLCRFWGGYFCDFTAINPEVPEPEIIHLGIVLTSCRILDCFTLECDEIFYPATTPMLLITLDIIELKTISDIVPVAFSGTADIEGEEFDYACNPPPIP
jgi:hypothetical protein